MRHRLSNFLLAAAIACAPLASHAFETANGKRILVIGGQQAVSVMDPAQKYDFSIRTIQQATYDALLKYEGDPVELKPWLATSWTVNDDATVWTFKLDPRAKFQNGDPVDAAAVKASFERTLKLNKGPAWMYTDFLKPENISVEDPQTLRFTLSRPYAAFLSLLPWWYVVNVKQAMANEHNGDYGQQWLTDHTAGSGPYRVKRVDPIPVRAGSLGRLLEGLAAAREGAPGRHHLPRHHRELQPRARGEIDIAGSLSPEDLDQLESVKGVKIGRKAGTGMGGFGLKFNTQGKYMSDLNLRRALAYAFDYDSLLKIYNGRARLMDSPFPPSVKGHVTVPDMPRRDMDKARAYLAKSSGRKAASSWNTSTCRGWRKSARWACC